MINYNQVNIRLSHPNLYRLILFFSFISIGLGLNFLFTNPTFNPYGLDKTITGSIFLTIGTIMLFFLLVQRNLKMVRAMISISVMWQIFWGIGTSITFFQGKTSLQLFVLYMGLSAIQMFTLIEPFINPITKTKDQ